MFRYLVNQIRTWTLDPTAPRIFKLPLGSEHEFIDFLRFLKFDEKFLPTSHAATSVTTASPVVVQATSESFCRIFPGVQILENGHVCVRTNPTSLSYTLGVSAYSNGRHMIRIKYEAGHPIMCILSQSITPSLRFYNSPSTYGWDTQNYVYTNGSFRQKSWLNTEVDDVFELTIDCDASKLEIKNERNQQHDEMQIDRSKCPFPWRLFVIFWTQHTRVRLL